MSKNKLRDAAKNPFLSLSLLSNLSAKDAPYFAAVGRFVSEYALAEAGAHLLARHLSGLNDEKARIIFSGLRLSDIADRIRQMMRADKGEDENFKDADACLGQLAVACLGQLAVVGDRRHKLVHRFAEFNTDAIHVTNALTAKSLAAAERDVFTLTDLEAMRADCAAIYMRFIYMKSPGARESLAAFDPQLSTYQYGPWRYTPAPPNPQKEERQSARQARKRQPDA